MQSDSGRAFARAQTSHLHKNLLWCAAIVAAAVLFGALRGDGASWRVFVDDSCLTIVLPDGDDRTVPIDSIDAVEVLNAPDFGACMLGRADGPCLYGTWHNDLWGDYELCATDDVPPVIVLTAREGTFVFNLRSAEKTQALWEEIVSRVGENGTN